MVLKIVLFIGESESIKVKLTLVQYVLITSSVLEFTYKIFQHVPYSQEYKFYQLKNYTLIITKLLLTLHPQFKN